LKLAWPLITRIAKRQQGGDMRKLKELMEASRFVSMWRNLVSTENEAAIKVIVEFQAKPGRRAALMSLLESVVAEHGPEQRGFLGSTRYVVLDNPNILVEIADWESAEARAAATAAGYGQRRLCAVCQSC
jgi:quinol monooxygenase YgiN